MALAHAILVSLVDRPQSGYDLAKRFDSTVGFFWPVCHQQIYQELHKMARAGLLDAETVAQSRPNRIVYRITAAGRAMLDGWIAEPTAPPAIKEELLVKLFALDAGNRAGLIAEVERRRRHHVERLARYEAIMAEHYPDPAALQARRLGRYLGLQLGVMGERNTIAWCELALVRLAALPADPQESTPR